MFHGIDTWIFDLDNTLYHPRARLFDQINARMTGFIMRELQVGRGEADRLRSVYWQKHGTTLGGLIAHHGIDPAHFLDDVHDIDLDALGPDPDLADAIAALPGRRIVHTNGARSHADRVLERRGLTEVFDEVYAIEDKALIPKPRAEAYARILALTGLDPNRAMMIEDDMRNLAVPKDLGMVTVWVCHSPGTPAEGFVDHRITDLTRFLDQVASSGMDQDPVANRNVKR